MSTALPEEMIHTAPPPSVRRGTRLLLLLTGLADDGGAEVHCQQLAVRLKMRGWDIRVATLLTPKTISEEVRAAGIPVESLGLSAGFQAATGLRSLLRIISSFQPQVIHAHMTHAVLAARFARLFRRVPVVIGTLHGLRMYNTSGSGWALREFAHRITDRLCDVTTVVCQAASQQYGNSGVISRDRLRVIPNGADLQAFFRDERRRGTSRQSLGLASEPVFLSVGRLDPIKNHDLLLRAFAQVISTRHDARLLIAGSGPLESALRARAAHLGIARNVQFLGRRADIAELMNAADCLVLTSNYEAMPLVLLEAAASNLPVIASDVGGNPEVVIHGETGFVTPVGDAGKLAETMSQVLRLPESRRLEIGAAARRRAVSLYDIEGIVSRWEALYEELLSKKGQPT